MKKFEGGENIMEGLEVVDTDRPAGYFR